MPFFHKQLQTFIQTDLQKYINTQYLAFTSWKIYFTQRSMIQSSSCKTPTSLVHPPRLPRGWWSEPSQPNTSLAPGQCLSWGCLPFRADGETPHPLSLITALICSLSRTSIDMLPWELIRKSSQLTLITASNGSAGGGKDCTSQQFATLCFEDNGDKHPTKS